MPNKYNIALIPLNRNAEIISLAQNLSALADQYLLGRHALPHVTLYHFKAEETELAPLWQGACKLIQDQALVLEFTRFSCVTFDGSLFWASLLPSQTAILHKMHAQVAGLLKLPLKDPYEPHMTLCNTLDKEYEKEVLKLEASYKPIKDSFVLSLGESGNCGQYTNIIYRR